MENITVFSNRLDESNGIVENVLEMKTTKKAPWFLRFAPKAKGIVSFVQSLLSPLTRKEGVRGGQLSAFFQSAAAAIVGIGLLAGSTGSVHGQAVSYCDPPLFDVCFHKKAGGWTSSGYAELAIEFNGDSEKLYEIVWKGYKRLWSSEEGRFVFTWDDVSDLGVSGGEPTLDYDFWWSSNFEELNGWPLSYGCDVYEGHWDWDNMDENGGPTWVRGDSVAIVCLSAYQEAALVYNDTYYTDQDAGLDFPTTPSGVELREYYCTIDWDPLPTGLRHGYFEGCWVQSWRDKKWTYYGVPGSPRFHYEESCSVNIPAPPRSSRNTCRW